jgi:RNA polymerase sigma-70 factor (ECF subfamily)
VLPQSSAGPAPAPSAPAFVDLHDAYRGRVTGFFFRRGVRPQDVEDLVQSTFAEAWRAWPTFVWTADRRACERQFTAWLFTIALHQLWNARRCAGRHAVAVPFDGALAEQLADDHAGAGFDQALDRALLAPALARLSVAERRLLADAYARDQDDRSLGHQLRLRPDTAKARRQRAVRHLAVALATGQPPRRQRRWGRRPAGLSERERERTAAARQRPNLAVLAA